MVDSDKTSKPVKEYDYKWCPETGLLWTACNCRKCTERRKGSSYAGVKFEEKPIKLEDPEFLWRDIKRYVEQRIKDGKKTMYTKSQNKRFWLVSADLSFIRVKREDSKQPYEDIPREDFVDIWKDLNRPRYISNGYTQKDLHGGQNRHTAVTFSILFDIPYIETEKVRRSLRYYLKKQNK